MQIPPTGFLRALRLDREKVPAFDHYPFAIPALRDLERLSLHPAVTFFVGENGSGKSTLLEALAVRCRFNAEGGSRNFRFETRASHSILHRFLTIERGIGQPKDGFFLRAESFHDVATEIERLDADQGDGPPIGPAYGPSSLHEQSHGQSFFSLLQNRLRGEGLYFFDEPESALSPQRQMSMLTLVDDLVRRGSQLVIATHSPILLAYPRSTIYEFTDTGIHSVAYPETAAYRVTRDFLNRHEKMLPILLGDLPGL